MAELDVRGLLIFLRVIIVLIISDLKVDRSGSNYYTVVCRNVVQEQYSTEFCWSENESHPDVAY